MTPGERGLVRETFGDIRRIEIPLSLVFYGRLFDLDPAIRPLFSIDMREQSRKLMAMLEAIVSALDDLDALAPSLRELGLRHAGYGVLPRHYETLKEALVWALGQALGPAFGADARRAWSALLDAVNAEMLRGAAGAVTSEPGRPRTGS